MKAYSDLVKHVMAHGTRKENRTGVDTLSTFGYYYEHDLSEGFPLLTTKAISWKNIVVELLWFLSGSTNIEILRRHGCKFWDAWADDFGKVPSAYGHFWRHFPTHKKAPTVDGRDISITIGEDTNDQIAWVLAELRRNPMSRRMVVSAWAPGNAQTSKLPPCHAMFVLNVQNEYESPHDRAIVHGGVAQAQTVEDLALQLRTSLKGQKDIHDQIVDAVEEDVINRVPRRDEVVVDPPKMTQRLCLHLTQRSCDVALGVPYNIASYALLLCLFSHLSGIKPGIFAHTLVDAHIYTSKPDGSMAEYDHVPGLQEQVSRAPRFLPRLVIDPSIKELRDIEALMRPEVSTEEILERFRLEEYHPHPAIPFKVAV